MNSGNDESDLPEIRPVVLRQIGPGKGMWRLYRLDIWPDLFGGVLLVRR